jgi:hypothetical protein
MENRGFPQDVGKTRSAVSWAGLKNVSTAREEQILEEQLPLRRGDASDIPYHGMVLARVAASSIMVQAAAPHNFRWV